MHVRVVALAAFMTALLTAAPAFADEVELYDLAPVLESEEVGASLEGVQFFWGKSPFPAVEREVKADVKTSVRTRKLGRSSESACQWVLQSALLQLRQAAQRQGADAVVNIRSNWNNVESSSEAQFQCASGFLMSGVALKADLVKLR